MHARKLERELIAATAELERTKEQLRVAREAMELARGGLDFGDYGAADETLANAIFAITVFTQPNMSADSPEGADPAKGEGGVPSTFPA